MEWLNAIAAAICSLLGAFGGGGLLYLKYNKQLKAIEVTHNQADEWKRLYDEVDGERRRNSEKIDELYKERSAARNECAALKLQNQQLCWYHCTVNGCAKRVPPHTFTANGAELQATDKEIQESLEA